ncbi:hypothetical protein EHS25_001968 [Saitozyma podzolica]|uniref:Uncharacterized protein n=1 Tax=Saitozyma podzolica TaxID=1890683 RepID=A0A427YE35_9TREE|nr:hypothetical protein EHS25_001968 [Saitozyma podzolica]
MKTTASNTVTLSSLAEPQVALALIPLRRLAILDLICLTATSTTWLSYRRVLALVPRSLAGTRLSKNGSSGSGDKTQPVLDKKGVDVDNDYTTEKPGLWRKPQDDSRPEDTAPGLWQGTSRVQATDPSPKKDMPLLDPEEANDTVPLPETKAACLWQARNGSKATQEAQASEKKLTMIYQHSKLPEKTVADKSGSNQGDRLPEKSGKPSNAKETSAKQELPEMDELDKASLEEPSPPSQKVKDTGDSKSGPEKTGKKDKESKKNKETEAVTEGNTSQEESSSELDPALRNISDQFQDIMKETPKSKKSDQVMEDFNGRSEEEQQEWVKDKLQEEGWEEGWGWLATVDDVREGEAFRKAPQQVPTMAHKNWKGDKKNVVHQQSPPRTKVDNQISSDKTTTLQKNKKQSDNQEQGTGEQDSQASYLYPLAMLAKVFQSCDMLLSSQHSH